MTKRSTARKQRDRQGRDTHTRILSGTDIDNVIEELKTKWPGMSRDEIIAKVEALPIADRSALVREVVEIIATRVTLPKKAAF